MCSKRKCLTIISLNTFTRFCWNVPLGCYPPVPKIHSKQEGYAVFSGKPISWWLWKYVYIYMYVFMYLYIYIYILPTFRVFFFLLTSRGLQPGSFQVKFVWLENSQFSKAEMIFSPILNPTILDCERCNPDFFPPTLANAMFTKKR